VALKAVPALTDQLEQLVHRVYQELRHLWVLLAQLEYRAQLEKTVLQDQLDLPVQVQLDKLVLKVLLEKGVLLAIKVSPE
jgi:hypothetical protein